MTRSASNGHYQLVLLDPSSDDHLVAQVSRLLMSASDDLQESVGGHVPDFVVKNIIQKTYTSHASIKSTFATTGFRFCLLDSESQTIATVLVAKIIDFLLVQDSSHLNVIVEPNTYAPKGFHHIFNLAVEKKFRKQGFARLLLDKIEEQYGHLLLGQGLWMRGEPPDHAALTALGFQHESEYDVFFDEGVVLPRDMSSPLEFNRQFDCQCSREDKVQRFWATRKLKYGVFTRKFINPRSPEA